MGKVDAHSGKAPVAIVTGAASGIGLATAGHLREQGWRVAFADRDDVGASRAARASDPLGDDALAIGVDVTDAVAVEAMVATAIARLGGIDALINIAGVPVAHRAHEIGDAEWQATLDVNLSGAMRCARAAQPALCLSSRAAVVNMSSVTALIGMPGRVGYSTAKAGLLGMTRVLAAEWAGDGIRVNAVAPGYVRTAGFERRFVGPRGELAIAELEGEVPLGRLCQPQEVASAIHFLASPQSAYVTGQTLVLDGGLSIAGRA